MATQDLANGDTPRDRRSLLLAVLAVVLAVLGAAIGIGGIWLAVLERRPLVVERITELAPILRAILARNADEASSLMAAHVRDFSRHIANVV